MRTSSLFCSRWSRLNLLRLGDYFQVILDNPPILPVLQAIFQSEGHGRVRWLLSLRPWSTLHLPESTRDVEFLFFLLVDRLMCSKSEIIWFGCWSLAIPRSKPQSMIIRLNGTILLTDYRLPSIFLLNCSVPCQMAGNWEWPSGWTYIHP